MQFRSRYISAVALVILVAVASCSQPEAPTGQVEPATPKNPLVGVWSVTERSPGGDEPTISPAQPGLYIFTKGHYSDVHITGGEARVPAKKDFEPTDEERVAQHKTITVNTGTYSVDGSVITFRPMVAKSPGFVGGELTAEFQINGDELTLNIKTVVAKGGGSPAGPFGSMKLKRIE